MKELDWFVTTLESEFQVRVNREEVSYEAVELSFNELDESLIPRELIHDLPEFLLFETLVYDSEDGTEWLGVIAMSTETKKWHLQMILKSGEPLLRRRV
ncbi:hypothetical protein AWM70_17300 [Paenibacillus yonginensis]|uniref:Uncharacterized protein n=1 Tax=Paenibacillus yonginensis TaxID=1462996 RepID=A0A1B1N3Y4_9BACL|nr:hypothetical protein [Paenibacillus yonginensis]ANS76122.1 hypothetical protein AWM70_17300 [Paenibacillus yonginensis]